MRVWKPQRRKGRRLNSWRMAGFPEHRLLKKSGGRGRPPLHQRQTQLETSDWRDLVPAVERSLVPGLIPLGILSLVSVLVSILVRVSVVAAAKTRPRIRIERLAIVQVFARHRGPVLVAGVVPCAAVVAVVSAVVAIAVITVIAIAAVTIAVSIAITPAWPFADEARPEAIGVPLLVAVLIRVHRPHPVLVAAS